MTRFSPLLLCGITAVSLATGAQTAQAPTPAVPDWALPSSPTHQQVAPPADFHRPSRTSETPIGVFGGESDIGSAVVPGSASFDAGADGGAGAYTIRSAGYNIWYTRDEFRYLWKRMTGDVSLAADVSFPDPKGYGDRKAVLVIRENLEDNAREAVVALHGEGMMHLAERAERNASMGDLEFRITSRGLIQGPAVGGLVTLSAKRLGIQKRGDEISLWASMEGEPMHQFGPPIKLHFDGPFYVGIGFTSHLPATVDTAVLSHVVLRNAAGQVQ